MSAPHRILVVRLSHLGDVVQTLPLFHALRAHFAAAEVAWVVEPAFAGLLRGMPGLDRIIEFDRHAGWRAWPRVRRALRSFAPDVAIDVQGNTKSAAITLVSGAARRIGPAPVDWREPLARHVSNEYAQPATGRHAQERVMAMVHHLTGAQSLRRDPSLSHDESAAGSAALAELAPHDGPLAIVQVGPAGDVRTPVDSTLVSILCELGRDGVATIVTSAPRDAKRAEQIASATSQRVGPTNAPALRCGAESLRSFAAWLGAAAERGAVFVSADSGPLHLAAAMGLRCLCLSGPFDWRRTGPWPVPTESTPSLHRVITADPPPPCAPCFRRRCHLPGGRICLESIDGARVARAALESLSRG